MKKIILLLAVIILLALPVQTESRNYSQSLPVQAVFKAAAAARSAAEKRALDWECQAIKIEFPYTRQQALDVLAKKFPDVPAESRRLWVDNPANEKVIINGKTYYFQSVASNMAFRNFKIMRAMLIKEKAGRPFVDQLANFAFLPAIKSSLYLFWKPYIKPVNYLGEGRLRIPRSVMPAKGVVKIWVPLPLATACQTGAQLISVTPQKYLKSLPKIDEDICTAYLEVPLDDLKTDLDISLKFSFSHYQQRFMIDPDNIGYYRKDSDLYLRYTASHDNILVTPKIAAKAREIAGDEKNPYRMAKKFYDYILANVYYSYVPHLTLAVLKKAESVYVHENGFGDCGSQSMYFTALCRAVGIPARATGGYQLVPGKSGPHFWAEFYLPHYGWIPVDPTVADTADWTSELTAGQRTTFRNYFFGNQDPYRFITQKDADLPLMPIPDDIFLSTEAIPGAVQDPAIICTANPTVPGLWVEKYWKFTFTPVGD